MIAHERLKNHKNKYKVRVSCRGGGIGRHAGFRCLWGNTRGGSSPLLGIIFIYLINIIIIRVTQYDRVFSIWAG